MPVPVPKGLLPGRGPAGRGAAGVPSPASSVTVAAGRSPASVVATAAGATGSATTGGSGTTTGATTTGASTTGASTTGASTTGAASATGAAAAAFLAGAFLAGAGASAGAAAGIASRSLRTTGASTVDEADFTNSPSSCSFARTSLLETPSSFASSWTRTFDTTLLSWSGRDAPDRQCKRYTFMLACSWGVHPRTPDPLVPVTVTGCVGRGGCPCRSLLCRADRVLYGCQVQWTGHPKGSGQCLLPLRAVKTLLGRVQVCSTARPPAIGIRNSSPGDRDNPNQVGRGSTLTAPDAHATRPRCAACRRVYPARHRAQSAVGSCRRASGATSSAAGAASDRISMRQPVRRAARRAFWPSRPMARDSW